MKGTISLRRRVLTLALLTSLFLSQPVLLRAAPAGGVAVQGSDTPVASPTVQPPALQEPRRGLDADGGFLFLPLLVQGEQRGTGDKAKGREGEVILSPPLLVSPSPLHPPLALSKRAEPATVPPGEVLTYTVAVTHTGEAPLSGMVLSDVLPAGLVYVEGSAEGFEYLPDEHRLVWTLPELVAGQALQGGFQARVTGYALGQVITNTVEATGGDLAQPVTATVTTLVSLPAADVAWITPAGGVLRSLDGRVEVEFPPEAVQERVRLEYRALPLSAELPPVLFCAFQLTAFTEREEPVRVFQRPVAITVHTRAEETGTAPAERLRIFWFDEESAEWLRLPTVADAEKGTLRSEVSHFGLSGAGSSIEYGAQLLPAVNGFSSDEWTGNSSIGYPLRLPPGPGGFAPSLALVYSTETVNGMRAGRAADERPSTYWLQAGVYGFGWNLAGLGAVTINLRNGQAHLSFGAGSFKLVDLGNNQWTTNPQTFLKIQHVGEAWSRYRWEIWTAEGTKYIFGDPNDNWGNGSAYVLHTTNCNRQMREAHLTRVEDTHGNAWTVEYTTETRGIAGCGGDYIKAIYPNTIRLYPAGGGETVRIVFVKDNVPGHPLGWRPDREINGHDNDYVEAFYADYRIGTIEVRVTEGGTWPLVRSYDLGYEYRKADPYDPNDKRGHSLLTSITEKGASGSALPAFTFSYANEGENFNWTKLGTADNGQGGRVTYVYQEEDFLMGPPYTCGAYTI